MDGDGLVFVRAAERSPSDRTPSRPVLEARRWTVKGFGLGLRRWSGRASSSREPCLAWRRLGPSRAPSDEYATTREVGQAVAPRATGSAAYSARSNRSWGSLTEQEGAPIAACPGDCPQCGKSGTPCNTRGKNRASVIGGS